MGNGLGIEEWQKVTKNKGTYIYKGRWLTIMNERNQKHAKKGCRKSKGSIRWNIFRAVEMSIKKHGEVALEIKVEKWYK